MLKLFKLLKLKSINQCFILSVYFVSMHFLFTFFKFLHKELI